MTGHHEFTPEDIEHLDTRIEQKQRELKGIYAYVNALCDTSAKKMAEMDNVANQLARLQALRLEIMQRKFEYLTKN